MTECELQKRQALTRAMKKKKKKPKQKWLAKEFETLLLESIKNLFRTRRVSSSISGESPTSAETRPGDTCLSPFVVQLLLLSSFHSLVLRFFSPKPTTIILLKEHMLYPQISATLNHHYGSFLQWMRINTSGQCTE